MRLRTEPEYSEEAPITQEFDQHTLKHFEYLGVSQNQFSIRMNTLRARTAPVQKRYT
jgi:hypothetical protein